MSAVLKSNIFNLVETGLLVLQSNGCIISWNTWMERHSNISYDNIQGIPLLDVLPELKGTRIERAIKKALEFNCPSVLSAKLIDASFPLYKDKITQKRKPPRIIQSILIKPFFQEGVGQHCVISIYDISSADRREKALREQSKKLTELVVRLKDKEYELQTIFQNTQNAIAIFDQHGSIQNINPAASKILNIESLDSTQHKIYDFFDFIPKECFGQSDIEENIKKELPILGEEKEYTVKAFGHQQEIPISLSMNMIPYEDSATRYFIFFRDITEKKRVQERLNFIARNDALTSLPNRLAFTEILKRAIGLHCQDSKELSIFFIDLDRFKTVNDKLGHDAGDILLAMVAERLLKCCRSSDVVSRWAGDEFLILLEHQGKARSSITIAEKIIDSLHHPFIIKNTEVVIGCSIGIAEYPSDGQQADELISRADQAMYQAKSDGRGLFRFFTSAMNQRMEERLRLETELRSALNLNQFELFYQPQISVTRGLVTGVEALIRWQHPERGLVMPNDFIPLSEDSGLIVSIGDWVLRSAIEAAGKWQKNHHAEMEMSINLSARQFLDDSIISKLKLLLDSVGVNPQTIVLEITENYLMADTSGSLNTLNALKALGVKIAIDDFGTGYSSLAYLRNLPVDIVKIDRAFLLDAVENETSAHIVSAIIDLAHALQLEVVAEGIESNAQLELLRIQGCDIAQGFLVAKPMCVSSLVDWYDHYNKTTKIAH